MGIDCDVRRTPDRKTLQETVPYIFVGVGYKVTPHPKVSFREFSARPFLACGLLGRSTERDIFCHGFCLGCIGGLPFGHCR